MTNSFIETIVQQLIQLPHTNYTLVLPSQRSVWFVKKEFAKQTKKTQFLPKIISIDTFIENVSQLKHATNSELLFHLYTIYKKASYFKNKDSFEDFLKWGTTIIQDFNEVDRYLLNPKSFFNYLKSIQDLNHWSLQAEQTEITKNYLHFWEQLEEFYNSYTSFLKKEQKAYQGLIYRTAFEKIMSFIEQNDYHYFIGFNALNEAEKQIILAYKKEQKGTILFDCDQYYYKNQLHSAGLFLREHKTTFFPEVQLTHTFDNFSKQKHIEIIATTKNISQVKLIGHILNKLGGNITAGESVAIVLADETLLIPVLNSLPKNIGPINITMGVPLLSTPFSAVFETIFKLHLQKNNQQQFYYKHILSLLNLSPINQFLGDIKQQIEFNLTRENISYVSLKDIEEVIGKNEIIFYLLKDIKTPTVFIETILAIINILKDHYLANRDAFLYELTCLSKFESIFQEINRLELKNNSIDTLTSLFKLYKDNIAAETLDLQGNATSGVQIMGVLETRVIDFDHVIFLGVNEGILPSGKSNSSFITYDMKIHYNLPTFKEKDAIYSYHFYRLLQRTKSMYLTYNSEADGLGTGEKSRFIKQLEIDYEYGNLPNWTLVSKSYSPDINFSSKQLISINKTKAVEDKLKDVFTKGISPSSLTSYIRNPIDFYHQKILGVKEYNSVEETIAYNTLGTVVHNTLEYLYIPYIGKLLDSKAIDAMQQQADHQIILEFKKIYRKGDLSSGKNHIILNVAKKYIRSFLKKEKEDIKAGHEIKIIALEKEVQIRIAVESIDYPINLRGIVDRIDEFNGMKRIIDYKTGKVERNQLEIYDWSKLISEEKYSKAFQILMYTYMLNDLQNDTIQSGIISFKNLSNWFMSFGVKSSSRGQKNAQITKETLLLFEEQLKRLILEIHNSNIPFLEKEI